MTDLTRTIEDIAATADAIGLPELARRADVPYTTLADWRAKSWRPKSIDIFERLARVADEENRPGPVPSESEACAQSHQPGEVA